MFSSDTDIDSENYLEGIEEAEGYDGVDGVMRIISENYENEMLVNHFMAAADMKEMKMLSESASAEDIQAHQEASASGVYNYLKGILQRFWAKIKSLFYKFIRKIKTWFTKRIIKKIKKNSKKVKDFIDNYDTFKGDTDDFEIKGLRIPKNIDFVWEPAKMYDIVAAVVAAKGLDDSSDLRDEAFKKFTATLFNCDGYDYDSFRDDYEEFYFEDEDDVKYKDLKSNKLFEQYLDQLQNNSTEKTLNSLLKDTNKKIDKLEKAVNKEIKKVTNKQKISDETEKLKYENRSISLTNSFVTTCSNAYFGVVVTYIKQLEKISKFCVAKSYAVKHGEKDEKSENNANGAASSSNPLPT